MLATRTKQKSSSTANIVTEPEEVHSTMNTPTTPSTTFACTHYGPPYPVRPEIFDPSISWPPSVLPYQLCYRCDFKEVLDSVRQHDAKIAAWKNCVKKLERRLQRKHYPEPLPIRQQIRTRKRQIEIENKRWLARLKNARERWRSVWGDEMPKELAYYCDEALVRIRIAKLQI